MFLSAEKPGQVHSMTPRICLPTTRSISREVFRSGLYEAQDVLAETNNVDLIDLQTGWGFRLREQWQRSLLLRGVPPNLAPRNPGLQKVRLTHDYDLFIAICQSLWDLPYINAVHGWKDRCKVSVCWLEEVWADQTIAMYPNLLRGLQGFDNVFITYQGA